MPAGAWQLDLHPFAGSRVTFEQLLASLVFGGGFISVGFALSARVKALRSRNWPAVVGTVVDSRVLRITESGRRAVTYRAGVTYSYRVEHTEYRGTRIAFGDTAATNLKSLVQRRVAAYPPGAAVTVYFDPANPSRSVLQAGPSAELNIALGLAALLAVVGCWLTVRADVWRLLVN